MKTILQIDFPFSGPFGEEMAQAMARLAQSIAEEPGLLWKIWTENADTNEAGGIYLFEDETRARRYLEKHSARLESAGVTGIRSKVFAVNGPLTALDHGPV
ncbi:putative monooxygenase [Oceanimonas sp. GK1]|uniref:monooxygenase n=1 Tax=Oceanimonas sp. (strain GK1 / IBRC-M 10197) TaxID=511062 RepID=UPI0002495464|nr:monooxygenase [Oceanimonas sp. GK1]AEY01987.1 putative monooxygenase [Oceanimonas sp. GK1]